MKKSQQGVCPLLLILGASALEIDVVKRAQQLGFRVAVTDNHKNPECNSPAKFAADEAWDVSWTDLDALEKRCVAEGVCGVIAGFSESRVEYQIRLCNRLGLPCDTTLEQLALTRDKRKFKALCRKFNIPVVKEFEEEEGIHNLPVIIKPTDRGGSAGIKVVHNCGDYYNALGFAKEASPSCSVVIEKFMQTQVKFDAYYLVSGGVAHLIATNDTLMCPPVRGHEICQSAWIFPSRHENRWKRTMDAKVSAMLSGIGLTDGYITISAFFSEDEDFYVFETGLRLSGELSYRHFEAATSYNYLDYLILRAAGKNPELPNWELNVSVRTLVLNFFASNGRIGVKGVPQGNFVDLLAATSEINSEESRLPLVGMLFCMGTDPVRLVDDAVAYSEEYILTDDMGRDMVAWRQKREELFELIGEV